MIQWWWLAGLEASVFLTLWVVTWRRWRRKEATLFSSMRELSEANDACLKTVAQVQQELCRLQRLEQTHRNLNESFEQQSKEAWDRYHAAGLAAGNAQSMLLRQLERAVQELNGYRAQEGKESIQVNPALRDIVSDFKREHVVMAEEQSR